MKVFGAWNLGLHGLRLWVLSVIEDTFLKQLWLLYIFSKKNHYYIHYDDQKYARNWPLFSKSKFYNIQKK